MAANQPITSSGLQMRGMPHPARLGLSVCALAGEREVKEHLRDHLLTAPECFAWAIVAPEIRGLVNIDEYAERRKCVQGFDAAGAGAMQALYDLYCAAVERDIREASRLGWRRTEGFVTVAIGTDGILSVTEDYMKTAFLPGQGNARAVTAARSGDGRLSALPRESAMRGGRPGRFNRERSRRELAERRRREDRWSREELLYYRVFRPAIQFIFRCYHEYRDLNGKPVRSDYALLKDALPRRSQLGFADWKQVRSNGRQA